MGQDPIVGLYRDLRNSFERLSNEAFSMEAIIQRHLNDRALWNY